MAMPLYMIYAMLYDKIMTCYESSRNLPGKAVQVRLYF